MQRFRKIALVLSVCLMILASWSSAIVFAENLDENGKLIYPKGDAKHVGKVYKQQIAIKDPGSKLPNNWWQDAVFYECYVASFKDSDGDGLGDFNGLTSKLDYLKDLGVKGIWLMPIMENVSVPWGGYETTDYRAVEKDYGKMEDFKKLLAEAHKRGIGIILDFVVNHSSSKHPFFVNSKSSVNSDYRNWYVWSNKWPGNWDVMGNTNTWHDDEATGYYFGGFYEGMPDWNFKNPSVEAYMMDNYKFWLNLGVDGFRMDAIEHLIENGPDRTIGQSESQAHFKRMRALLNKYKNRFMICETENKAHFGSDEFNSGFAFGFNNLLMDSVNNNDPSQIDDSVRNFILTVPKGSEYSLFLTNHDSFAGPRPFKQFGGNESKCKLAASLLLTLPGIPFLYYGEEIGIDQNIESEDGDPSLRTPMQWTDGLNAGFTDADKPYREINANYTDYNVDKESKNIDSIFSHYKKLISIRNLHPALVTGNYEAVKVTDYDKYYAFIRTKGKDKVVVVMNFTEEPANIKLDFTDTSLAKVNKKAGKDLYSSDIAYPGLNKNNYTNYTIENVSAYGIRIIQFVE